MALDTYTGLVAETTAWLMDRQDLAERVPTFIRLAESDLNARLRERRMQRTVEAVATCGSVALPPDWLEAVRVNVDGCSPMQPVTPHEMGTLRPIATERADTTPVAFAIVDDALELSPQPSDASPANVRMTYYAALLPLSADNATNWLLRDEPGLYLYGALLQAAPFLMDDQRIPSWRAMYEPRIAALNAASKIALHSGGPLIRRRTDRSF